MYRDNLFPPIFPAAWACDFGEDRYGLWMAFSYQGVRAALRWIEPGTFMMGSPKDEEERDYNETLHQVTLNQGFWLAETTVTQALWQVVMGNNPSRFDEDENNPVENVNWNETQNFIQNVNLILQQYQPEYVFRLPTEAEWEYSCRAGTTSPFSFGNNITPEQVNYDGNYPYAEGKKGLYRRKTVPVKSLPANPWGLYEMHGNVWEWCQDYWVNSFHGEYDNVDGIKEPTIILKDFFVSDDSHQRVIRGGSWLRSGGCVRSAYRSQGNDALRSNYLGFRFALGLQA